MNVKMHTPSEHDSPLIKALKAAYMALRSYEYGNASTEFAKDTADRVSSVLDAEAAREDTTSAYQALYLRYLGALGVLCECAVEVEDEMRDSIGCALDDAEKHYPVTWKRIGNRFEVQPLTLKADGRPE